MSPTPPFDVPGASAARAEDALRRGWPIRVEGLGGALDVLAVENAAPDALAAFAPHGLLLSAERAATLKLTNQRAGARPGPVLVACGAQPDPAHALAIADPSLDLVHPLKGPFRCLPLDAVEAAEAAVDLARHAGMLPAFFVRSVQGAVAATTDVEALRVFAQPAQLRIATRARLPVSASASAEIVAFRSAANAEEHVALLLGNRDESVPVARVHSECLTGDVFGSLKCDCGPQLHGALDAIAGARWGVLLYLRQEGRGIGLINKLRAYSLQDQGFDTVDANTRLGFPVEARDFGVAAQMLRLLSVPAVRLLTNNPEKVARLQQHGIVVAERLPLALPANPHNAAYLDAKRDRTGHLL